MAMIGDLAPNEVPDANTLFNVSQRLGGSIGISLLISFFELRERLDVDRVLHGLGTSAARFGHTPSATPTVPPLVRAGWRRQQ